MREEAIFEVCWKNKKNRPAFVCVGRKQVRIKNSHAARHRHLWASYATTCWLFFFVNSLRNRSVLQVNIEEHILFRITMTLIVACELNENTRLCGMIIKKLASRKCLAGRKFRRMPFPVSTSRSRVESSRSQKRGQKMEEKQNAGGERETKFPPKISGKTLLPNVSSTRKKETKPNICIKTSG